MSELSPEASALKDQGNACFAKKEYEEAINLYTRALDLSPASAILISNLAASHLGLKQWAAALAAAERCLAADPAFSKGYGRKAAAQRGMDRPGDAERTLLAGLARDGANALLNQQLADLRQEEDGDQSPCRSRDGSDRPLRDMQSRVGIALTPYSPWPSPAFQAAFIGDDTTFAERFRPSDLRLRVTEARLPLLIVVVSGAQRIRGPTGEIDAAKGTDAERGTGHSKVLRRVLDAGARVDGRDAAGFTALHHATAHHSVLDLAEMLIAAGADVNGQDRYGTYPLVSAVMSAEVRSIKLLLAHGAKPDLKDNDGCDSIAVSRFNAEIQALIHKAQFSNQRPGGGEKACAACSKAGAKKACAGCGAGIYYCDRQCQMAHWPAHKASCKKAAAGAGGSGGAAEGGLPAELRVDIRINKASTTIWNMQSELTKVMANLTGTAPPEALRTDPRTAPVVKDSDSCRERVAAAAKVATRERAMRVKIQVPQQMSQPQREHMMRSGQHPDSMLCYNHDRSLMCDLDGSTPAGQQLSRHIRQKGIQGLKGYFAAYFDESCGKKDGAPSEMVVRTAMLPAQPF